MPIKLEHSMRGNNEADKINIHISSFRFELIKWLSEHKEK